VQGERPMAADNKTLGRFILDGIPPAPRGIPQIEVTFDIDADGILNVSAQDKATGREQHITITASSGLTEEEIERMVKEAREHEAEDKRRKEEIEARNNADSMAYTAEKTLRDLGDKVPSDVRSEVEAKVKEVREAMQGKDIPLIRRKTQELAETMQKIGARMYEAAGGPTPPPGEEKKPPKDEGTVEGEFREV
ncbi:MAG: Hsp70 family protein, partial [Anaerolineae bacterium]